ncbi:MAG: exosortase O [Symploca sp. SIO2B6]|nr:exosortase O [Symploca sp. SIO2B6]
MHAGVDREIPNWQDIAGTCLLVTTWLYANISSIAWLVSSFRHASSLNLMVAGILVAVVLWQLVGVGADGSNSGNLLLSATPKLRTYPLLLMLGSTVLTIALKWLVDIPQLNVLLFALGSYGLCGLFLAPELWRKGIPVAGLFAFILPFSAQFGSGLGFPLRVLTAQAVEHLLAAWQVSAISSHDIIVLENGIAHVDLPCSGLKSLWTGTLFLLAATWLEARPLGVRWLMVWVTSLLLFVWVNMLRVLLLVIITHVWKQPQIAQILHVPLGLIGFIGACALSWLLLQKVPKGVREDESRGKRSFIIADKKLPLLPNSKSQAQNLKLAWILPVVITLALVAQLKPPQINTSAIATINLPQQMVSEPIPLTKAEQSLFDNPTHPIAQKWRFELGKLSGSMLVVTTTTWHAHHPPELCFVGNGLKVDGMERKQLTPQVMARWLSLQDGKLSATYWFQSTQQTTDSFLSRIWDYVIHRDKNWVMISALFDSYHYPENSEIKAFATTIYEAIDNSLKRT